MPACSWAKRTSWGYSALQGSHQVAKKFTTTQRPLRACSDTADPAMAGAAMSGAGRPTAAAELPAPHAARVMASTPPAATRAARRRHLDPPATS